MNITIDTSNVELSAIRLCTVSQVLNDWLGSNNSASATSVNFVNDCIDRITGEFEEITELPLVSRSVTGYYDGTGTCELYTNCFPISSVTSVKYRNTPLESYSTSISSSNIVVYYDKIVLYNYDFTCGLKNYEIIYNAGYSTGSKQLKTLEGLAIKSVVQLLKKSNNPSGLSENSLGLASAQGVDFNSVFKEVIDEAMPILLKFKRI